MSDPSLADPLTTAATVTASGGAASTGAGWSLPVGATLGRYVVVDEIGSGSMGVVYAAYDPRLDRKVAIKLVRAGSGDPVRRARLLREGQVLARLAHPNVVAVHDVGDAGEHVFITMEFVQGETLTRWLAARRRAWPELLAIFSALARGLAAAHRVNLVHRDLKPDNLMIDDDGRPRVMDFGLARVDKALPGDDDEASTDLGLTRRGAIVGTPRYMAPEQWRGAAVDARADQFALCVAFWEALYGEPPFRGDTAVALMKSVVAGQVAPPGRPERAPSWLRRVLLRGLSPAPERRFASVEALLAALAAGRRRWLWRRGLALAGVAVLVVAAVFAGRALQRRQALAACGAAGAEIAGVWNDEVRTRLRGELLATGLVHAGATAGRVMPWIDCWAGEWSRVRTEVCVASEVEETRAPALSLAALACLGERREALQALLAGLAAGPSLATRTAVLLAADLPVVASCVDPRVLARRPAAPADPAERAEVDGLRRDLLYARTAPGKLGEALVRSEQLLTRARTLAHPLLVAEAHMEVGLLAAFAGESVRAEAALVEAFERAGALGADELAANAAVDLVLAVGEGSQRPVEALLWARVAGVEVRRIEQYDGVLGARLRDHQASALRIAGDHAGAVALNEEALALRRRLLGPEHPSVGTSLHNLAVAVGEAGDHEREGVLIRECIAVSERALGPEHPDVVRSRGQLAVVHAMRGEFAEAIALQEQVLASFRRTLSARRPEIAITLANLAEFHQRRGELELAVSLHHEALAAYERSIGGDHPHVAATLANLAEIHGQRGDLDGQLRLLAQVLVIQRRALPAGHDDLVATLAELAAVHARRGDADRAAALRAEVQQLRGARPSPASG